MLRLLHMGPSKVLTTFFIQIQSSHSWSCPLCRNTLTPPTHIPPLWNLAPPLLMLHSRPTLDSKPLIPHLPIIYLLPLPSLAPGNPSAPPAFSPPPPDSLRILQWNAGGLRARSTELLHFLSSHPVDLICIQESNLNSSFRIPGFSALRSYRTHSRSGILSPNTTHASCGVVIFVRQGLSFSELSTSSLSSLNPYSDYVGINISLLTTLSRSLFSMCTPPPIRSSQRMAEPTPFLPPSFPPPEISSFWGTSIAITPSGTQEVPPTPTGRKYSTGLFLLTSSPSMTLTHLPFSIAPLAVAPPLTSPLLPPFLLFPAPRRCYRTWVLTIYQFYLSLSLRSFAPTSVPLSSIFRKLAGIALPPTLTLTVLQQRNTRLFLFPLLLLSLPLWH